jgi:crossover junction endodeoxyribonuclease RuvC
MQQPTKTILGIDIGLVGGAAIVAFPDGADPELVEAVDIPVVGTGARQRIDAAALRDFIRRHTPGRAVVEAAQAMPAQGVSSVFRYGRAAGTIETVIALCDIPFETVSPASWKRAAKLGGRDKEASRQRAIQRFPRAHSMLARKKDHGRAEAALIALYGAAL